MSCLLGLYLDSFQTTTRHSCDGWSIYIAIFNLYLQGFYPVGVTDVQPYFMRISSHNTMNIHWIPTKFGTEIHYNEPFTCAKFQLDWSTHWCFTADFAKCAKSRRKNEEIKTKFWLLVSRNELRLFSSNLVCCLPFLVGTSVANLISIG